MALAQGTIRDQLNLMAIEIQSHSSGLQNAVRAFNERMKAGGQAFRFPEHSISKWLPPTPGETLYEEYFLACDGEAVRGGYILKHQSFWLGEAATPIGCLYMPVSEGAIDPTYSKVGVQLILNALKRQPLLYSLGMGGLHHRYPKMLIAAGWKLCEVPFHFMVIDARSFCRNIAFLRRGAAARLGLDLLAATGLGSLAFGSAHAWRQQAAAGGSGTGTLITEFGEWADEVWRTGRSGYTLTAIRDGAALRRLYPAAKENYLKLRVNRGGTTVGWAVARDSQMKNHKQFGDMRVGSIIDCFAIPGGESAVITAATNLLRERGVHLIVSNQSHRDWNTALDRAGFLRSRTNFIFGASQKLAARLSPWESSCLLTHFTRGDGEGPSHL
jgi:hypothetical protein